jgi:hypothetical protein
MANFINIPISNIGTTPVTIFTATASAVVIGCNVANTSAYIIPVDIILNSGVADTYIKKGFRIANGDSEEVMKGNKITLQVGDSIIIKSEIDNSIDVILSLVEV